MHNEDWSQTQIVWPQTVGLTIFSSAKIASVQIQIFLRPKATRALLADVFVQRRLS